MRRSLTGLFAALAAAIALHAGAARAEEPWRFIPDIEIESRWPAGLDRFGQDRVTAVAYRPRAEGRVPAAVIVNSSGGVTAHTEHYYARLLAANGMAALVVDSFTARGVRRTGDDQNRVHQHKSNADAFAGRAWLARQDWVDTDRIVVLGMSRGGEAAYSAALLSLRGRLGVGETAFAAHIAIAPGSCNFPQRDVRTIARPIFFMLAELDPVQRVGPCVDYAERMRRAGQAAIRIAVYPGVYHAYEGTAGIGYAAEDWASYDCAGRFERDANFILYDRRTGRRATTGSQTAFLFETCLKRGYAYGGDIRVKAQATADLLQFLRDVDILRDERARAVVPDCATVPPGPLRLNCTRARAGWTGDLVPLAKAYLDGPLARDEAQALRLLELATERGHPRAQWELSILLRRGVGGPSDPARALRLATLAAEAGDPAGMNVLGVMIRDGIGRPADDALARPWFERAHHLRNSYGTVNLAVFLRDGRGGLARDPARAVALLQQAVARDDNPWALVLLAEALEKGNGAPANRAAALALYRAAAAQDREPEARRRAAAALARLGETGDGRR